MSLRCVTFMRPLAVAALTTLAVLPAAAQSGSDPFGFLGDRWQVGGLVYVSPTFEGAKSYQVTGFPFVAPAGFGDNGIVQIKGADDIRFRVLQFSNFEVGPLAGYRFGRDETDADHLIGTGDIDGGFVLGAFAAYRAGPLAFSVSYHHQATGDETGGLVRFGVEGVTRLSPTVKLTTGIGTNYATDDYMTAFFGVSAAQNAASGLPVYNPSAGFKDVHIGATANIDLSDRWTLILIGRYAHLIGDAADSPIVETESQFYGGAALSYKFSIGR
jgi:outer membrane scaffolding protein for murein synthesis (MipA/OmpV family)